MNKLKIITCLFFIVVISDYSLAQKRKRKVGKKTGLAWEMNIGATNMLGDLGGADKIGESGIKDLDLPASRYCVGGGIVLNSLKTIDFRLNAGFLRLNGSDSYTENEARKIRNITVNTNVFALNALMTQSR